MATCLIGLGSNLGDRSANLLRALELLDELGSLRVHSAMVETMPAGGPPEQPNFLNAAALVEIERSPREVLVELQRIERQLGRRYSTRWGQRSIDLDLLLYDQCIVDSLELVVPHPRMPFRRFVLLPAAEIAAERVHPTTQYSIRELLTRLDDRPIHVSVLGVQASAIAGRAAEQVGGVYLERPPVDLGGSFSPRQTLEFLRRSIRDWDTAAANQGRVVISDYWIGEAWTGWSDPQTLPSGQELLADECALPTRLASPQMALWLKSPHAADSLDRSRLRSCVFQPRQFPVLTCQNTDVDWAVAEITAAVQAMV